MEEEERVGAGGYRGGDGVGRGVRGRGRRYRESEGERGMLEGQGLGQLCLRRPTF